MGEEEICMKISISQIDKSGVLVDNALCDGVNFFNELDRGNEIELSQELERDAFERVVSDLHLRLSNADDRMSDLFTNSKTRWLVKIKEEGEIFSGEIDNESIEFDVLNKWCEFDIFSNTKKFWEKAEKNYITKISFLPDAIYMTVNDVMQYEFITRGLYADIIDVFEVEGTIASRQIRAFETSNVQNIKNLGMYKNLDGETTHKDLLEEFLKYYNAEIFLDGRTVKMQKRNTAINTTVKSVTPFRSNISYKITDGKKYDYFYTNLNKIEIPTPEKIFETSQLISEETAQLIDGEKALYFQTAIINGIETHHGDILECEVIETIRDVDNNEVIGYKGVTSVKIKIKTVSYSGIASRKLYRKSYRTGKFHLLKTVMNNTEQFVFEDTNFIENRDLFSNFTQVYETGIPFTGEYFWIKYDEETATWEEPIYDLPNSNIEIDGEVFEIKSDLKFYEHGSTNTSNFKGENYYFFGRENKDGSFLNQWVDLFKTKKKMEITVGGVEYKYGDTININAPLFIPTSINWLAKKVTNKFFADETEMELIEI